MNIQVSHIQYKRGDDIRANAHAIRNRLFSLPAFVKPAPEPQALRLADSAVIQPKERPLWQVSFTMFNEHVICWQRHLADLPSVAIQRYIRERCRDLEVLYSDIMGPGRSRELVEVRRLLMFECYGLYGKGNHPYGKSLPELGRAFKRDHTVILHAVRKIQAQIDKGKA